MDNIKQKTKLGMVWNVIEKFSVQIINFILNIILARLLSPYDYGTIGMLTIYLTFSNVFIDSGFSRALIQKQDRTEIDFSTTLIFNFLVSCVLYVILFFASPAIANFYKTPELVELQRVFFLVIILNSLTVVQSAQLQINVDFKKIAFINSFVTFVSGVLGIICAYKGFGVWALVVQSISKAFFSAILFWIYGRWIPKTGFSFDSFKKLFNFGSKLLISGFLGTSISCLYRLIIGKVYKPDSLGYYTRAGQFTDLTCGILTSVLNTATFPLMSSLQNNQDEFKQILKKLICLTSMIVFPAMIGLAVLSKPIIIVLLGDKWSYAADLLFWICFAEIFTAHNGINMNVLNAIGRSDLFLKVDLIKFPFMFAMMAITFPISLKAIVIGRAICSFIYFYINAYMPGKLFGFGPFKQLLSSWKYILSSIIMGICVYILNTFIVSPLISLILGIISGIILYSLLLLLLKDKEFLGLLQKILKNK